MIEENNELFSNRIKHLDYIQNIITRMNTHSFQIKTWTVSIVTALLAISISSKNTWFIILGIMPTAILWLLDAYYLNMERKFRKLYDEVAKIKEQKNSLKDFEMRPDLYNKGLLNYLKTLKSTSLILVYALLIVLLIIINLILI